MPQLQAKFSRFYHRVQKTWTNLFCTLVDFVYSIFIQDLIVKPDEVPLYQACYKAVGDLINLGRASVPLEFKSGRLACEVVGPYLYLPNPNPRHKNQMYLAIGPGVIGIHYFADNNLFITGPAPSVLPFEFESELLEAIHLYIDQYHETEETARIHELYTAHHKG